MQYIKFLKIKKFNLTILIFALMLCNNFVSAANMQRLDGIEAIVNAKPILTTQVDAGVKTAVARMRQMQIPMPSNKELRKEVIKQLGLEQSILSMADKAGIQISEEEVLQTLQNIAQSNGTSISGFKTALQRQGINFNDYRDNLLRQLKVSKIQQMQIMSRIQVSDSEVEEFLQTSQGAKLDNRQFRLGHILLEFGDSPTSEEMQKSLNQAEDIKDRLERGEEFSDLAKKYSKAGTADKGGDLGWQKITDMPNLFANQLSSMQKGDIAGPLKTSGGLHIIKLLDKRFSNQQVLVQYRFNRLLIKPNKIRDKNASLRLAKNLRAKLNAKNNFANLAKEYSDDLLTKQKGGWTDWVLEQALPQEILTSLKNLPKNAISQPLKTNQGWEIWQKLDTKNIDMSEASLKNQVKELLFRKKFAEQSELWLNNLKNNLYIEYKN